MCRFWIYGVVITTIAASATSTDETGCIGRCRLLKANNKIHYLRHNDSNKYCTCIPGSLKVEECGPGKHWSEAQECCVDRHPVADNAVTKGCKTQCPVNYTALIAHKSRSKYCHCKDGRSTVKDCPLGFQFSVEENTCIAPEDAKCDGENDIDYPSCIGTCPVHQDPDQIIFLAHDECLKYCRCVDGKPITRYCPYDNRQLYFNLDTKMCTSPEESFCTGIGAIIDPPTSPPKRCLRPHLPNEPPRRPLARTAAIDSNGCIGKCPIQNPLHYTMHLPHEECGKFCKCDWGKPVLMDCPSSLHFNRKLQVCDFPFNAECTYIGGVNNDF